MQYSKLVFSVYIYSLSVQPKLGVLSQHLLFEQNINKK